MKSMDLYTSLAQDNAKDMLRFITCGNVDDGKSTLIGRLLLECGAVYDDQFASLHSDSKKFGTVGDDLDAALLLDGLEDERQQGITIDVAYRYFATSRRKFIIADTPGHEQFTRNMVTGASTADLAIILVDASKGLTAQTRRHAYIVTLLGIKQVVLAVNKMDLAEYRQNVFDEISTAFADYAKGIGLKNVISIPLSALRGDNVLVSSNRTLWYSGEPLLQTLESVEIAVESNATGLRFPIQWVNRPNANFRGFSGTVASGSLKPGDEIVVMPSRKSARVKSIVCMEGTLDEAQAKQSVTVTLDKEIDIARGDMLVTPQKMPIVDCRVEVDLVWMSEQPLVPGKSYWLKHTTYRSSCEIEKIVFRTDVNTLQQVASQSLAINEIGRCELRSRDPLVFDPYTKNRETGSIILVDRVTHETAAAGMLRYTNDSPSDTGNWNKASQWSEADDLQPRVNKEDRQIRYSQKPLTVLITGLSGSGKTSIALALEEQLFFCGNICIVLDSQNVRKGICRDLGFSTEDRSENLRRAAEIAKLINDAGQICIAAFVAPSAWVRESARQLIGDDRFFHVHLYTESHICRTRKRAQPQLTEDRDDIESVPGVTFAYEVPHDANLTFDTSSLSVHEVASQIMVAIKCSLAV